MNKNRKIAAITIVIIILLGLVNWLFTYLGSFQTITITSKAADNTFSLYSAADNDESTDYDKNNVVFSTSQVSKHRVKKGSYVYVISSKNSDYQSTVHGIDIGSKPVSLSIPSLHYTDKKLNNLLEQERSDIQRVIQENYPTIMPLYTINKDRLYNDGQWYGAKLTPINPATYDTVRIVLKKENGSWVIVTKPPQLTIGAPLYPGIPGNVLTDVNNFL